MATSVCSYEQVLRNRVTWHEGNGFEPTFLPECMFDFQRALVKWACTKGRAAILADCGLGKTLMQLVWAENVVRNTNKPVLLLTPLAVTQQTQREAERFGIEAHVAKQGGNESGIVITNYERIQHFDPAAFAGLVCDESSAIKNFDGKRKDQVTQFARNMQYRLLCTATAAPNDYHELGTSSEALGYLGFRDMITKFFTMVSERDGLGWGRTKYRLRGWAERPFWQWVVSWARACRKPSDLGFSDDGYDLPPLNECEHVIKNSTPRPGMLIAVPARGLREEREERRVTINERVEKMAELSAGSDPVVNWCQLNDEADMLEQRIPDAVQVKGSMKDEQKEEYLQAFTDGEIRCLITKPKIGCWGLNWQHCNTVNTFPSHSFEQYYQAVRRCWRFGQQQSVTVNVIATEGEAGVTKSLKDKQLRAEQMFSNLVDCMNREISVAVDHDFPTTERIPQWL